MYPNFNAYLLNSILLDNRYSFSQKIKYIHQFINHESIQSGEIFLLEPIGPNRSGCTLIEGLVTAEWSEYDFALFKNVLDTYRDCLPASRRLFRVLVSAYDLADMHKLDKDFLQAIAAQIHAVRRSLEHPKHLFMQSINIKPKDIVSHSLEIEPLAIAVRKQLPDSEQSSKSSSESSFTKRCKQSVQQPIQYQHKRNLSDPFDAMPEHEIVDEESTSSARNIYKKEIDGSQSSVIDHDAELVRAEVYSDELTSSVSSVARHNISPVLIQQDKLKVVKAFEHSSKGALSRKQLPSKLPTEPPTPPSFIECNSDSNSLAKELLSGSPVKSLMLPKKTVSTKVKKRPTITPPSRPLFIECASDSVSQISDHLSVSLART